MRWLLLVLFVFVGCTSNTKKLIDCETDKVKLNNQLNNLRTELAKRPKIVILRDTILVDSSKTKIESVEVKNTESYKQSFSFKMDVSKDWYIGVISDVSFSNSVLSNSLRLDPLKSFISQDTIKEIREIYVPDPETEKQLEVERAKNNQYEEVISVYKWITFGIAIVFVFVGIVIIYKVFK
jgi:hypothetical protein